MTKLRTIGPRIGSIDTRRVRVAPKTVDPFYRSDGWRKLIAWVLQARGRRCEDPDHNPREPRDGCRIYGDHIVELRDGGAPLDPLNVMLRCASCHGRKTAAARAARMAR